MRMNSSLRKALRRKSESSDKSPKRIVTQRPNTSSTRSLRSVRVRAKAQSLHSDQTSIPLGRYVATELEPELGHYVATELEPKLGRYVATKQSLGCYVATELEQELGSYVATGLEQKNSGKHGLSLLWSSGDSIRRFDENAWIGVVSMFGRVQSLHSDRTLARARSLRSDRTGRALGRYVATELWLELGR
ncbi:hypothetical protein F2Q69_00014169 [Brassica cretica]|uniref:Uncharacterized protein n=1 Tax=Brassica cretica TaxID=69181 RepID=A0A8S9QYW8_BRACR|nr:hypothetical protein F2Q69_00014169 [Brassica cretica]